MAAAVGASPARVISGEWHRFLRHQSRGVETAQVATSALEVNPQRSSDRPQHLKPGDTRRQARPGAAKPTPRIKPVRGTHMQVFSPARHQYGTTGGSIAPGTQSSDRVRYRFPHRAHVAAQRGNVRDVDRRSNITEPSAIALGLGSGDLSQSSGSPQPGTRQVGSCRSTDRGARCTRRSVRRDACDNICESLAAMRMRPTASPDVYESPASDEAPAGEVDAISV